MSVLHTGSTGLSDASSGGGGGGGIEYMLKQNSIHIATYVASYRRYVYINVHNYYKSTKLCMHLWMYHCKMHADICI